MENETNWTSIDLYFKGFHIKKSFPENVKLESLMESVEKAIKLGFEPSWNKETSSKALDADPEWAKEKSKNVCLTCGQPAEMKSGVSKAGKPWKGIFCTADKQHVQWL